MGGVGVFVEDLILEFLEGDVLEGLCIGLSVEYSYVIVIFGEDVDEV